MYEGVEWFKACGLWQDGGYIPKTGDIIFFDWTDKHDGHSDHEIQGYGTPMYE